MKATTPELDDLLRHFAGRERMGRGFCRESWHPTPRAFRPRGPGVFRTKPGVQVFGAVDPRAGYVRQVLNRHFALKEFYAGICFIDMVGFSAMAKEKTPREIAKLATTFISAVVEVATQHQFFVDKTLGDEVMLVAPLFPDISDPLYDVGWFIADLATALARVVPTMNFNAGVAFGNVVLTEIQTGRYHEWTVYGNCVNGAKRLQTLSSQLSSSPDHHAVLGAIDTEQPKFREDLQQWLDDEAGTLPLLLSGTHIDNKELKGIGFMSFLETHLRACLKTPCPVADDVEGLKTIPEASALRDLRLQPRESMLRRLLQAFKEGLRR